MALWLPQIAIPVTDETGRPARRANCDTARFWSRRVMAYQRSRGTFGALRMAIRQFVLQGLPTTSTRASFAAAFWIALPVLVKIGPLTRIRSLRS